MSALTEEQQEHRRQRARENYWQRRDEIRDRENHRYRTDPAYRAHRRELQRKYRARNPEATRENDRARWDERKSAQAAYRERNAGYHKARQQLARQRVSDIPGPRNGEPWTLAEMAIIARTDLTVIEQCYMLGRSYGSVSSRRQKLRDQPALATLIAPVAYWTPQEDNVLHRAELTLTEMASLLPGRTYIAVKARRQTLRRTGTITTDPMTPARRARLERESDPNAMAQYQQERKQRQALRAERFRDRHQDRVREYQREWKRQDRERNPDKPREQKRRWREENHEQALKSERARYRRDGDRIRERGRRYHQAARGQNPEAARERDRLRNQAVADRKRQTGVACKRCSEGVPHEFTHGRSGYRYHECRCDVCVEAARAHGRKTSQAARERDPDRVREYDREWKRRARKQNSESPLERATLA